MQGAGIESKFERDAESELELPNHTLITIWNRIAGFDRQMDVIAQG